MRFIVRIETLLTLEILNHMGQALNSYDGHPLRNVNITVTLQ